MNADCFQSELCTSATLIVLAGGEGRRMGIGKSHLQVNRIPILVYLLNRVRWTGPTVLSTAAGREHPPGWEQFDLEVTDKLIDRGPLGGIQSALQEITTPYAVCIPVDMPNISSRHLAWFLANVHDDPGIALDDGRAGD